MKQVVEHVDSDSGHTPPEFDKELGVLAPFDHDHLPPDPDEGLSDEEKARIVLLRPLLLILY